MSSNIAEIAIEAQLTSRILLMSSQTKYHSICLMGSLYHWSKPMRLFRPL